MDKSRHPRFPGLFGLVATVAALLAFALPAVAMGNAVTDNGTGDPAATEALSEPSYASCPGELSQPFLSYGDDNTYSLAPGGAFEPGDDAWFLTGDGYVGQGNEPGQVHGADDQGMLVLPGSSTATSVPICITKDHPNFRFFAYSEGAVGTRLRVQVLFLDRDGDLHEARVATAVDNGPGVVFDSGTLEFDSDWQLSPQFPVIANNYLADGETGEIELLFTPVGGRSSWSIDDVYIDPRHRS